MRELERESKILENLVRCVHVITTIIRIVQEGVSGHERFQHSQA